MTTMLTAAALAMALATAPHAAPKPAAKHVDVEERAETDTFSVKGGTDQGYCVRLMAVKTMECHWTLTLAKGQLMVDGPVVDGDNPADTVLAVTGGTGIYKGARGEMVIHARDPKATAYDFHYKLM